ncbi:hypothetical protein HK098_000706, partial [Nowakowskiella sp. JEL0407]
MAKVPPSFAPRTASLPSHADDDNFNDAVSVSSNTSTGSFWNYITEVGSFDGAKRSRSKIYPRTVSSAQAWNDTLSSTWSERRPSWEGGDGFGQFGRRIMSHHKRPSIGKRTISLNPDSTFGDFGRTRNETEVRQHLDFIQKQQCGALDIEKEELARTLFKLNAELENNPKSVTSTHGRFQIP